MIELFTNFLLTLLYDNYRWPYLLELQIQNEIYLSVILIIILHTLLLHADMHTNRRLTEMIHPVFTEKS